jgi:hypothetical protein
VLPEVDRIIMIENGNIVEMGTYDELRNLNGFFSSFIKSFLDNQYQTKDSKNGFYFMRKYFYMIFFVLSRTDRKR